MVAPVRLVVLSSASGDGLLCCLKYAVSQLLDTGVMFLLLSVSSSLHSTSVRFGTWTSL